MPVFKKIMIGAAALSMTAAPVAAHAADASKLSVARSSAVAKGKKSELAGGGGFVVAIIAAVAVIAGIIIVANNDNSASN